MTLSKDRRRVGRSEENLIITIKGKSQHWQDHKRTMLMAKEKSPGSKLSPSPSPSCSLALLLSCSLASLNSLFCFANRRFTRSIHQKGSATMRTLSR